MHEYFISVVPFIILIIAVYLLMIRRPISATRKRQAMLNSLEPGDRIVTVGYIYGHIVEVKEHTVIINITVLDKVIIEMEKDGIMAVLRKEQ